MREGERVQQITNGFVFGVSWQIPFVSFHQRVDHLPKDPFGLLNSSLGSGKLSGFFHCSAKKKHLPSTLTPSCRWWNPTPVINDNNLVNWEHMAAWRPLNNVTHQVGSIHCVNGCVEGRNFFFTLTAYPQATKEFEEGDIYKLLVWITTMARSPGGSFPASQQYNYKV